MKTQIVAKMDLNSDRTQFFYDHLIAPIIYRILFSP